MIIPLCALQDNYIWAIKGRKDNNFICIDPGEADPVIEYAKLNHLHLTHILITHHHYDHTNGIDKLMHYFNPTLLIPNAAIHPRGIIVSDQLELQLESIQATVKIISTPGHTLDHVTYVIDNMIFTGDTLFSGGCGRVFEGTHKMLYDSLQKIATLPEKYYIYCGHEYTYNNLLFAKQYDPNNIILQKYFEQISNQQVTLPSTLATELAINPFLRCQNPDYLQQLSSMFKQNFTEVELFTKLRTLKDNF